jgi:CheY-like chemotaxis protein
LQAGDGVKALRLARKLGKALDLIVSDIEMPGGDGLTFVRSLRSSLPAIPIILISGNADPGNLDRLGGFCEFLQKPFTPKTLLDAVDRAAKFPDQLQANQGA